MRSGITTAYIVIRAHCCICNNRRGSRLPPKTLIDSTPIALSWCGHYAPVKSAGYGDLPHLFRRSFPQLFPPYRGGRPSAKIGKKSACNTIYSTPYRHGGGASHTRGARETAQITHYPYIYDDFMSKIWQLMTILSQFFSLIINVLIDYVVFFPMTFWEKI